MNLNRSSFPSLAFEFRAVSLHSFYKRILPAKKVHKNCQALVGVLQGFGESLLLLENFL